jgi:hypothetical protein
MSYTQPLRGLRSRFVCQPITYIQRASRLAGDWIQRELVSLTDAHGRRNEFVNDELR